MALGKCVEPINMVFLLVMSPVLNLLKGFKQAIMLKLLSPKARKLELILDGLLFVQVEVSISLQNRELFKELVTNTAQQFTKRMVICMQHKPYPLFPLAPNRSTDLAGVSKGGR
jgi:hypothetical protein